jgi:hypothetical protein
VIVALTARTKVESRSCARMMNRAASRRSSNSARSARDGASSRRRERRKFSVSTRLTDRPSNTVPADFHGGFLGGTLTILRV